MDTGDQKGSTNAALPSEASDADLVGSDSDLVALAAHLSATAPFAAVDPTFKEALRTKLVITLTELRYTFLETPLGRLYLAYSGEVLRLVSEGDKGTFLAKVRHILGEEPVWESAPPVLITRCVLAAIRGQGPYVGPLDLSPLTPFQQAVLDQVRQIPWGKVRSYDWVAHEIGYPQAVHDVCMVLVNNPFPFVIPSHRVVHSNGALSDYTEVGIETKERVLAYEGVNLLRLKAYLTEHASDLGPDYKPSGIWETFQVSWKRFTKEGLVQIQKVLYGIIVVLKVLAGIGQDVKLSVFHPSSLAYVGARTKTLSSRSVLDLEQVLTDYEANLQARTSGPFRVKWAVIQNKLGNAYRKSASEEQNANLKRAIACYEAALQVCRRDVFPGRHRFVQICRAEVEARQRNWANVHTAYMSARAAEELLLNLSTSNAKRSIILKEGYDLAVRDGFALARLGWLEAASVVIERGQARWLNVPIMALEVTAFHNVRTVVLKACYKHARQAFITTEALLNAPLSCDLEESERRQIVLKRTAAHRAAQKILEKVVAGIRTAFPGDSLDARTIEHAAQRGGAGYALVYLIAAPWGGVAVAALNANPGLDTSVRLATLELPALTDTFLSDLSETRLDDGTQRITGGFIYARRGDGFDLILHEWEGRTFRERAEALHAACIMADKVSTLDKAIQRVLRNPSHVCLVDQPLEKLTTTDTTLLKHALKHAFFQLELERCLKMLAKVALRPLVAWLREQGATSLSLVPCGSLATFPLAAVPLTSECSVGDTLVTSVVPTAQSLLREEHIGTGRSGIHIIGSPHPGHYCSIWCEMEVCTLTKLASSLGMSAGVGARWQALGTDLFQSPHEGHVVYISCRRAFDSSHFFQSALGEEHLTLSDLLKQNVDVQGPRLLILSACQATVFGERGTSDETRNLAAELVLAGARAVLASLWLVDGRAAYLLITRFAQEWFPRMDCESPARALAHAQRWLRTVTNRDLQKWCATSTPVPAVENQYGAGLGTSERVPWSERVHNDVGARRWVAGWGDSTQHGENDIVSAVHVMEKQRGDPDDRPYMHPMYWAGFQITGW